MAVEETLNHAENPRLTKAASAVGEEWYKVATAEPGRLALGPHSASSMFFPGCTVASSLLMGIKGLFLIEPLGFIFGFFFPPVRYEKCDLLAPTTCCHLLFFLITYQAGCCFLASFFWQSHTTPSDILKQCPLVLLLTVIETVVSNTEQTMERNQFFC